MRFNYTATWTRWHSPQETIQSLKNCMFDYNKSIASTPIDKYVEYVAEWTQAMEKTSMVFL